ncbi:hypothetical protein TNCV_4075931 [Trichonephila clavipes]|nr:hypothetical protein TNCV_4075931 [Trichonephila clavipes]
MVNHRSHYSESTIRKKNGRIQDYSDGPRNSEPRSSDKDDPELKLHSPNFHTTPNYMRAFGDKPHNFEPWSSDKDDT